MSKREKAVDIFLQNPDYTQKQIAKFSGISLATVDDKQLEKKALTRFLVCRVNKTADREKWFLFDYLETKQIRHSLKLFIYQITVMRVSLSDIHEPIKNT